MQIVLVFAALVAIAVASPVPEGKPIAILQFDDTRDEFGQYSLSFKSEDGTIITRQGVLKPTADGKDHVLVESGSNVHIAPDGTEIRLTWEADEEGYRAKGDHLPVPPPLA